MVIIYLSMIIFPFIECTYILFPHRVRNLSSRFFFHYFLFIYNYQTLRGQTTNRHTFFSGIKKTFQLLVTRVPLDSIYIFYSSLERKKGVEFSNYIFLFIINVTKGRFIYILNRCRTIGVSYTRYICILLKCNSSWIKTFAGVLIISFVRGMEALLFTEYFVAWFCTLHQRTFYIYIYIYESAYVLVLCQYMPIHILVYNG